MAERIVELDQSIKKGHHNKVKKILKDAVLEMDVSILDVLKRAVENEKENGLILNEVTKAYFRISRKNLNDCAPLFELWNIEEFTVQESLLEVLGYDQVISNIEDQKRILEKYFDFGCDIDCRYFSDPRYGLAAACAGWDAAVVQTFLEHCLTVPDTPLKYVAQNSLKKKYVRLR